LTKFSIFPTSWSWLRDECFHVPCQVIDCHGHVQCALATGGVPDQWSLVAGGSQCEQPVALPQGNWRLQFPHAHQGHLSGWGGPC